VNAGDTVTWHNNGPTGHSATAKDGSFNTGILPKGQSASHTFTKPGTYAYICTPHPFMHGTIKVVAASSGSSGSSAATSGSSSSSGTTSGSSTGSTTSSGSSTSGGSTLPKTGSDAWLLAALGLAFLAGGAAVQRRARASD
jgi:LPXTG-motif cell wall-anchored protein